MANDTTETKDTTVPKNDAYTGMLVISLLALIAGSVFLYLDYSQYQQNPPPFSIPAYTQPKAAEKAPEGGKKDGEQPPPVQPPMPDPKGGKQ